MKRLIIALVVLTFLMVSPCTTSAKSAKDYFEEGDFIAVWVISGAWVGEVDEKNFEKGLNEAIWNFNKAIELNPRYAEAYYKRGFCYIELGKQQQAIRDFNRAIEINPRYAEVYIDRGLVYKGFGNYEQFISDYKTAARLGYKPAQNYLKREGIQW